MGPPRATTLIISSVFMWGKMGPPRVTSFFISVKYVVVKICNEGETSHMRMHKHVLTLQQHSCEKNNEK